MTQLHKTQLNTNFLFLPPVFYIYLLHFSSVRLLLTKNFIYNLYYLCGKNAPFLLPKTRVFAKRFFSVSGFFTSIHKTLHFGKI